MTSSRAEPDWLYADDMVIINRVIVTATGKPHALTRPAELESAVARPLNAWHYENERDLLQLGIVLLEGLCRNHPFEQGNKRTAFAALVTFCEHNHVLMLLPDTEWVADLVLQLVTRELTIDDLRIRLADFAIELPARP